MLFFIFVTMIFDPAAGLLTFWQQIQPFDTWLLTHINQDWSSTFLDTVLPFMRETFFWIPLYLFLVLFVTMNFGLRGLWWLLGIVLTAALSDIISSQIIKQHVMRVRPCQDASVAQHIRFFINYCPKSSSFTSSHACSHFAQAMFFFLTLRTVLGRWTGLFFVWAFVIAYTQVYVGVHYPFDVFCGALIGCGIGFATGKLFNNKIGILRLA
ncbi:phosphatase PAP2 family protein [Paraflavitalea soli]|uniref:Phosphatase PAP2 family protein n=2 Tax=Paraflavitalea soli TaxID=2315862 RepID=A0A3B7MYT0_9BACT|nr:phosphatase PAP2 family protein [Paraflavitalea soli]